MITFTYRWKIPPEQRAEFQNNWEELTEQVRQEYGMHIATLYLTDDDFVSITHWPTEEAWKRWKTELAKHPYRTKWRSYRVSGPDRLERVARVGTDFEGA